MWLEHVIAHLLNGRRHGAAPETAGVLLGHDVQSPHAAVRWPDARRAEHAVVIGKSGSGKTHLLELIALALAQRGEGFAFFDFHGDASLSLIARLRALPSAAGRLVVLDPSHPTRSPGLNVLEAGASDAERFRKVSELSSILRQRWGVDSFGARTEELLRNSLYSLAATRHTLADLPRLLTDTAFRHATTAALDHPDICTYWRERYEPLSEGMKAAFREPLLNRVTAFLTEPAARHLLSQPHSTIDIADVMAHQQWLIVRLPKGRLREHAHTLGNLIFAQLQFAALAREALPVGRRHLFTLLCDELQNLVENDVGTLLAEGRKFGTSVATANQYWDQLPRDFRGALLSAATHICFRISAQDAAQLAPEISLDRRNRLTTELTQLVRGEAIGRFGAQHVRRFRVPALPRVQPLSSAEFEDDITPVTRDRREVEAALRASAQRPTARSDRATPATPSETEEGHRGW